MSARQMIDRSGDFNRLLSVLKEGNNYILTTHKNCDPDGIGSELGLFFLLTKLGKTVSILNPDKTPIRYQFIDPQLKIHVFDPEKLQSTLTDPTVVIVDNSDLHRIGQVQEFLNSEKSNLIIIDHHNEVEAKTPGIFSFPEIGSTSEIIYELIELSGNVPDYNASVALYLGIIMDTGQFKYNKTRPRTHEIAAKLLQNNFPTEELSRKLFEDFPYQKLFLKRDVYQSIKIEPEHKLASLQITQEVLKKYDSSNSLGESLVNELLGPVEIVKAVIFTESDNGQIKISFRSKGKVDVCMIAKEFGGGGHTNASGATVAGSLEEVKRKVLERLRF